MSEPLRIVAVEAAPLDVALRAPFTIASARLERVENVVVRVALAGGAAGWGEIPTLPPVTAETQPLALAAVRAAAAWLVGDPWDAGRWRAIDAALAAHLPGLPAARAGVVMAVLDAFARHAGVPLRCLFGGAERRLTTDITVPICAPREAGALAAHYRELGFEAIKTKVGLDLEADVERVRAIHQAHPRARLILDANGGYDADGALDLVKRLRVLGSEPALLEQPVPREDWDGLGRVAREAGVPVAADESCATAADALRIARDGLAQVVNVKLAKCGLVGALDVVAVARAAGLGLMIGGMIETRLAMGCAAHFAAGLGGFAFVDLDTPHLLADDPIAGGPVLDGPVYDLSDAGAGHGGAPREWPPRPARP